MTTYTLPLLFVFLKTREESYRTSISIYASFAMFTNVEKENGACKHFVVIIIGR